MKDVTRLRDRGGLEGRLLRAGKNDAPPAKARDRGLARIAALSLAATTTPKLAAAGTLLARLASMKWLFLGTAVASDATDRARSMFDDWTPPARP